MSKYVEIQVQSPADGSGFVAQWYANGERSGQVFPLLNTGELLFFAYYTEAPMIVPDDATRAMLRERATMCSALPVNIAPADGDSRGVAVCFCVRSPASSVYGYGQSRTFQVAGLASAPLPCDNCTTPSLRSRTLRHFAATRPPL
jgi:hypothetical protein